MTNANSPVAGWRDFIAGLATLPDRMLARLPEERRGDPAMDSSCDPPERFRDARDQLHELVARDAGPDDFGPDDYLPGLTVLLQSLDYDPQFSETGRRFAWGLVVDVLKGRVQAIRSMKENPGFDAHPIVSPVVITGIPRAGTTALHRLRAVDQRFQGLQTWLLDSPMPRPPIPRRSSATTFACSTFRA